MFVACFRRMCFLGALALLLMLVSCGSQTSSGAASASSVASPTSSSGIAKPLIYGLIDMGSTSFNTNSKAQPDNSLTAIEKYPGAFRGKVINVTWAQLQPSAQTLDTSVIDQALNAISAYNQSHPTAPLLAKLRVWAGRNSPDWVKHIGGPITVVSGVGPASQTTYTLGAFWSQPYIGAWTHLQTMLAAHYDTNPLVAVVAASTCSSNTDEPNAMPLKPPSIPNLLAAGFTDAAYTNCLLHETDPYSAWKYTYVETTYGIHYTLGSGKFTIDTTFALNMMKACRATLGSRCTIGNHNLGRSDQTKEAPVYADLKAMGPPIALQTASPPYLTSDAANWTSMLKRGIGYGASSVELWPMGFTTFSQATVQQWAQLFPSH